MAVIESVPGMHHLLCTQFSDGFPGFRESCFFGVQAMRLQGLERRLVRQGQGRMSCALREMPEDEKQALMRSIKPYSFQKVKAILQEALEQESQANQEHRPLGMGAMPQASGLPG